MTHSIISPSSAHIWGKPDGCTKYPTITATYPKPEPVQATLDGNASHKDAEAMIEAGARAKPYPPGEGEFYDAAKMYADDAVGIMRETGVFGGDHLGVEKRITAPRVHAKSFGTPDFFLYNAKKRELIVEDYKSGHGIVEAFENWPAINYTAGLLDELKLDDQQTTVRIRIVQPRAFHRDGPIREWKVLASDLRPHINSLNHNAHEALSDNATFRSGSHCKYCPARHTCTASIEAGFNLYEAATQQMPIDATTEELALHYSIVTRALEQLEFIKTGTEEQLKSLMRQGENIPGYRRGETKPREKWVRSLDEIFMMGDMFGHDLRKPGAVTPAQARKLGVDAAVIAAYSERPSGAMKLEKDDLSKAKQIFQKKVT